MGKPPFNKYWLGYPVLIVRFGYDWVLCTNPYGTFKVNLPPTYVDHLVDRYEYPYCVLLFDLSDEILN